MASCLLSLLGVDFWLFHFLVGVTRRWIVNKQRPRLLADPGCPADMSKSSWRCLYLDAAAANHTLPFGTIKEWQ